MKQLGTAVGFWKGTSQENRARCHACSWQGIPVTNQPMPCSVYLPSFLKHLILGRGLEKCTLF